MVGAIAVEQRQYKTYVLSLAEPKSVVEIVPQRGGIVTRWQFAGKELFYLDSERFTHPELTVRGGNPILFPLCGNVVNNTYNHNGQPYTIKQHGFARELPWQAIEQSSPDQASLVISLESNEQTQAVYPFDFELRFTYTLDANLLATSQTITNRSNEPMPFSLGFHPYFAVGDKTKLEFDIPSSEFLDQRAGTVHSFSNTFDLEQDELDLIFKELTAHSATVTDRQQGTQLKLEFSDTFGNLVFWTVKGKDFYCLEPWTAGRNALNTGDRLIYLDPGASLNTFVNLHINLLS